jgi:hypothetical protein
VRLAPRDAIDPVHDHFGIVDRVTKNQFRVVEFGRTQARRNYEPISRSVFPDFQTRLAAAELAGKVDALIASLASI